MMIRRYVYLNNNNEVILYGSHHDDVVEQGAIIAAFESGARFVEVPITNKATLGWYFDGNDYVQYPTS
jgi:hypothetical protein